LIGVAYLTMTSETKENPADRSQAAEVRMNFTTAAIFFGIYAVISFAGGLVFNTVTVSIPKIIGEGVHGDVPLTWIGSVATMVLLFGGAAQLTVGRLVSRFPPHILFAAIGVMQAIGIVWAAVATGFPLLVALAVSIAAIYGQVTVGDVVIARYTADAWRGRIYAVRFFLAFISSGLAVAMIAALYGRGGFELVLGVTAAFAAVFAICTILIALLISRVEGGAGRMQPAE
jgi:MFS family permease